MFLFILQYKHRTAVNHFQKFWQMHMRGGIYYMDIYIIYLQKIYYIKVHYNISDHVYNIYCIKQLNSRLCNIMETK